MAFFKLNEWKIINTDQIKEIQVIKHEDNEIIKLQLVDQHFDHYLITRKDLEHLYQIIGIDELDKL